MSEPRAASKRRWWWIGGAAVVAIVLAFVLVTTFVATGSTSASVTLVPSSSPGANPFTASVASGSAPAAAEGVVKKSAELRTTLPTEKDTKTPVATGTTPGLYGGSGDTRLCDPQQLVDYLKANPRKAAAWAHVLGIAAADMPKYVATLTPVLLNSDTLVENHGYSKGNATSLSSVLQAGTAVMVDATGTPRVKCNCGNPLTPPHIISLSSAHLIGPAWQGYAPSGVIAVQPGKKAESLSLVDVSTGAVYTQLVGSSSGWVAASWASSDGTGIVSGTVIQTSADGTAWSTVGSIPNQIVTALVWGDGLWVAVADPPAITTPQSTILTSRDLKTWTTVASVPGRLTGVAFGDGQWVAVGTPTPNYADLNGQTSDGAGLVYSSKDATRWQPVTTVTDLIQQKGLDGFESVGFGDGKWIAVAGGSLKAGLIPYESTDGTTWTAQSPDTLAGMIDPHIAYSPASWLITTTSTVAGNTGVEADGVIAVSKDSKQWQVADSQGLTGLSVKSVGFGSGRWLATVEESDLPNPAHALANSQVMASTDGTTWTRAGGIGGPTGAIAYGGTPTAATTPAPSPSQTSTPAPDTAPDCSAEALQAVLVAAGRPGKVGEHACSGIWAVAGVGLTDAEVTVLYKWVDGAWTLADRTVVCAQNVLPEGLVNPVCHSN
ncbi:DUF6777 domain-containing protein [Leifsonia poae]|uniref:DUF6777 domain-containing protein n=1 Tax=Leifsonia poae TaxID=110933 RepID=UPI003D66736A